MSDQMAIRETVIPGLYEVDLVLHNDNRGWFKENYQRTKMEALGLPHFEVVQNNFSFNSEIGVTRGLHAEPWEKFISVANGKVFGVWVDLRAGESFGKSHSLLIDPGKAVFVPRGVANGYQTLEAGVTYTYLVNEHWSPEGKYSSVNLFDERLAINWPIPKNQALVSERDTLNPMFGDIIAMEF